MCLDEEHWARHDSALSNPAGRVQSAAASLAAEVQVSLHDVAERRKKAAQSTSNNFESKSAEESSILRWAPAEQGREAGGRRRAHSDMDAAGQEGGLRSHLASDMTNDNYTVMTEPAGERDLNLAAKGGVRKLSSTAARGNFQKEVGDRTKSPAKK